MSWEAIVGQPNAVAVLSRAVEDPARLSHAYLFAGPEGVGRRTAARCFAQALNCERAAAAGPMFDGLDAEAGDVPCGECRTCRLIADDKHPDIEIVAPGGVCEESEHKDHEGSRDIRVCQIRRIERVVSRTAVDARYRVIIIDPADAMNNEAANAFLKTLEEPAPNVILLLITAREEALPETVRSRCRRVAFTGVPRQHIEEALRERWEAEPDEAARLARLAGGRLGWAVAALADERYVTERDRILDEIAALMDEGLSERFSYAASLGRDFSRNAQAVHTSIDVWSDWWRDVLLTAAGKEDLVTSTDRLDTLRQFAQQYGVSGALQALQSLAEGREHLQENASATLAMEVMFLDLPERAASRAG